ncbi:MAG TPA: SRPBCC domain-containing protein [Dehalococcoidia bacterium]|nr:SRPBCC domain-containing protein [Dehalococcoidia bacterium]
MSEGRGRIECDEFLAHPPSVVWRAITDPGLQARWWAPGDVRPVVGHCFTLDLGGLGEMACEVLAVEPERMIRYRLGGGSIDTILTWRLVPEGRGTRLLLMQEGFDFDSPLARDVYERMNQGWPIVLHRMEPVLREFAIY